MATTVDRRRRLFDGYARLSVALGGFLVLTYLACSIWDGLFPSQAMRGTWQDALPGFEWWSWGSFFLGLVESFAYGFWFALVLPAVRWALPARQPARTRELVAR